MAAAAVSRNVAERRAQAGKIDKIITVTGIDHLDPGHARTGSAVMAGADNVMRDQRVIAAAHNKRIVSLAAVEMIEAPVITRQIEHITRIRVHRERTRSPYAVGHILERIVPLAAQNQIGTVTA